MFGIVVVMLGWACMRLGLRYWHMHYFAAREQFLPATLSFAKMVYSSFLCSVRHSIHGDNFNAGDNDPPLSMKSSKQWQLLTTNSKAMAQDLAERNQQHRFATGD